MIAASTLGLAVAVSGRDWPRTRSSRWLVALCVSAFAVVYTIFSEWLNVEVRQSWAYDDAMPLVPLLGTALTPALQWLILPPVALGLAFNAAERDANSGGCDPASGASGA